ncbi:5231_t:CDS:2 [Funneliformis geosporum]|nr:5231_t:CDS:2 [Funneliformis geosporum]
MYWYQKAAKNGYKVAHKRLENLSGRVIGKKSSSQKAPAADNGNDIAQFNVGECYELGHGVERDEVKAFEYYQKSANQGYFGAKFLLGYCYMNGMGTNINKDKGFELYDEAAGKNGGDTSNIETISDLDKVHHWYHEAANDDSKVALYKLGEFYEIGKGVDKNLTRAFEFYKKSADQGYSDAQYVVGYYYDRGVVIDVDKEKALYLFRLAAEKGNSNAQKALANKYEQGDGIEKNIDIAIQRL